MKKLILAVLALSVSIMAFAQNDRAKSEEKDNKNLPLKSGRTFDFDLTEGSWIALDVSPDGTTIVFDFLGDIYSIPVEGGDATQLTEGMQFDAQPRFSPDGKEIIFISDESGGENVWILNLDTKEKKQITTGNNNRYQSPEWAPDGKYMIASRQGGGSAHKIWLYHVDGGSGVAMVKEPNNLRMLEGAFSNDDQFVWFSRRTGSSTYNAPMPQYQISKYDRETGEMITQTSRYGSAFRPTPSSDGKWLVYATRHETETGLILRNLTTGDESWLAYPIQHDDQESRASRDVLPGFSWTPDDKNIVISYGGKMYKIDVANKEATEIPFRVKSSISLGPELDFDYPISDDPQFTVTQIRDIAPSPDGKQLALTALNEIYLVDLPDGKPKKLLDLNETQAEPVWSPDGEWLAFVTWQADGGKVFKVRPNGKDLTQLNQEDGVFQNPVWNNDGSRIVLIKGQSEDFRNALQRTAFRGTSDLIWISADGSGNNFISYTDGRYNPHFTKSSDRIFLSSNRGLLSIRWDGTDEKAHVQVKGKAAPGSSNAPGADWIKMAREGDQALAAVGMDLFVVTVPQVSEEAPTISVANEKNSTFPFQKLTDIGGQFPAWSWDNTVVHWAVGNAHVAYNLNDAKVFKAQKEAEEKAKKEAQKEEKETEEEDPEKKVETSEEKKAYEPEENRVEVRADRDIPKGTVILKNARLLTMKDNEVLEGTDILIENNRIKEIGKNIQVGRNVKVIDLTGKTILPGFVDTHSHFRHPVNLHRGQFWPYLTNLAFGVTTTRDPQTATTDVLTYGDLVDAGKLIGPRIYSTGPGIFGRENVSSLEHARKVMKRYSAYYNTKTVKMYGAGNRQQRQWIIQAAREQNIMPTTEGGLDFKNNLTQVIDGYPGHEHSFPIFPLYEDVIDLVAFSRTVYTPTLLVAYGGPWTENYFYATENPHADPKLNHFMPHWNLDSRTRRRNAGWFMEDEYVHVEQSTFAKDLVEAGGRAGIGSHGQLQGLGYHWELWAVQSGGMTEYDALRVATIIGAEAIGLDQDLGTLEVGKLGDLVILNSNPLDDIKNSKDISHVMFNGRLYEGNTLDEIHPQQKKMEKLWWQDVSPKDVPGIKF